MNCCDQSLKKTSCNQGRDCPVRDAAQVAKAKPIYTRCDLVGACQGDTPCPTYCKIWDDLVHADQVLDEAFERNDRRLGLLLKGACVLIAASVLVGVLSVYSPLLATGLDWLLVKAQLGLYRWAGVWS